MATNSEVGAVDLAVVDDDPVWTGAVTRADVTARARRLVAGERLAAASPAATLRRLSATWALAAAATVVGVEAQRIWVWVIVWALNGWIFAANGAILHETVHGHLFASKGANRLLGTFAAATIFTSFSTYRAYHFEHHLRTATKDDPEGIPLNFGHRWHHPALMAVAGVAVLLENAVYTVLTVIGRPPRWVRTASQRRDIRLNAAILAVTVGLAVLGLVLNARITLQVWLVPAAVALCVVLPFLLLPEHYGATGVGDILDNTRTVRSNRLLRWFFWNTNYHAAHHLTPSVPFHRLPDVDRLLDDAGLEAVWRTPSYLNFHWGTVSRLAYNRERQPIDIRQG